MTRGVLYSLVKDEADVLAATKHVRSQGLEVVDVYTPYAVHGLDKAMGLSPSRLTWVCFGCGALGALSMTWFQFWTSAVDWPINVGGKPWNSLPAFVPVLFEFCVLLAGLGAVAALFLRCGLLPGRAARIVHPAVTDNRFVLAVYHTAQVGRVELHQTLAAFHVIEVTEELLEVRGGAPCAPA